MHLKNEQDVIDLIAADEWMMGILKNASMLGFPDWCICAGFIRSKVWDVLHGYSDRTPLPDVDVIYFDPDMLDEQIEKEYERKLFELDGSIPWSVKNQARMHTVNDADPYVSSEDGISNFPETATAIGITIDEGGILRLIAPYGVDDLLSMKIRPTPSFKGSSILTTRLSQKNWPAIWPEVEIVDIVSTLSLSD